MDLDLKKLVIFQEIARCKSFSVASEKLFMSQSTVSMHMKRLEDSLGLQLLKRGKNETVPTPEGKMVLKYADRIMSVVNEMQGQIEQVKSGNGGVLHMEMASTVHSFILPDIIHRFCIQYPEVNVEIRTDRSPNIIQHILDNRTHIGVIKSGTEKIHYEGLSNLLLEMDDVVAICASNHNLVEKKEVSLADIATNRILFYGYNTNFLKQIQDIFSDNGLIMRISAEIDDINTVITMVSLGDGICMLPSKLVEDSVEKKKIEILKLAELKDVKRYTHLLYKIGNADSPKALEKLVNYIKEYNKVLVI